MAKVEIAILQTVFNSGKCMESISSLYKLLKENENLEPVLKSDSFLKLGQWSYEAKDVLNEDDYK